ncbi:MAG: hypothetical protein WCG03_07725 [Kiritimatiellales bacterium]
MSTAGLILIAAIGFAGQQPNDFRKMDKNTDGLATLEEIDAWFKWRAETFPEKFTYQPDQPRKTLEKLDGNGDGALSLEEWVK